MNSIAFATFIACFAAAHGGYYGPSAKIIQGPSSKTTLIGPEGSVISAVAPGGQIVHEEHPGYISHAAPVSSYAASYAAPVVSYDASYAAHAPVLAHAAPIAYAAPVGLGHETHISKYGTHITHGSPALYSAPAVVAHAPVAAYAAAPLGYAGLSHGVGVGHHGLEGLGGLASHSLVAPYHAHGLYGGHHQGLYAGHHQGLYL